MDYNGLRLCSTLKTYPNWIKLVKSRQMVDNLAMVFGLVKIKSILNGLNRFWILVQN
jgi:hypothetical protein